MILKKLKPDGLINSDEKAYRGMDRDFEKSSDVIPVTLKGSDTGCRLKGGKRRRV